MEGAGEHHDHPLPPGLGVEDPAGGVVPALYNAANEEAVAAFVAGRLSFPEIVGLVARTLDGAPELGAPSGVDDVLAAERWAREHVRAVIAGGSARPRTV